jgi:ClpP class serine protease
MRTQQIKNKLANGLFATCPKYMESLLDIVNSGEVAKVTIDEVSPSHSYDVKGNVAIISIDGATTKKNTWMNAMCGGFASYDILSEYIDKAESNQMVDTILFNIDSPGGEVAGVDEVGEKIFSSTKKTVTFYNNLGASAAIWAFSASKERYANKTAMIGSIGVMAGYRDAQDDSGSVTLVSKNAQNKNCSLNGDCKQKIQIRIDDVEAIFYERVIRNTGLTSQEIAGKFGYGDVVSSLEAKEAGFLKEITTFDALLKSLQTQTLVENPSDKPVKQAQENGVHMEFSQENFDILMESRTHLNGNIKALNEKLEISESALTDKSAEVTALTKKVDDLTVSLSDTKDSLASFKAEAGTRVQEAITTGVNAETAVAMINADSAEDASKIALGAKESDGGTPQTDTDAEVAKAATRENVAKTFAKSISV